MQYLSGMFDVSYLGFSLNNCKSKIIQQISKIGNDVKMSRKKKLNYLASISYLKIM